MSSRSILRLAAIFLVALLTITCTFTESRSNSSTARTTASPSTSAAREILSPSPVATPISLPKSLIRSVDFDKVTYPELPDFSNSKAKKVTRKSGAEKPTFINYGDITGDGAEEAMVVLALENRGSAIPYYVYVFTMEKQNQRCSGTSRPVTALMED